MAVIAAARFDEDDAFLIRLRVRNSTCWQLALRDFLQNAIQRFHEGVRVRFFANQGRKQTQRARAGCVEDEPFVSMAATISCASGIPSARSHPIVRAFAAHLDHVVERGKGIGKMRTHFF